MKRILGVVLPLVVVVVALAVGASGDDVAPSEEERAQAVAGSVRCPTCAGQSVASSGAPAAAAMRDDIARRVAAGQSDEEIKASLVAAYGERVLMNPPAGGVAGLVWVIPVAGFVVALGGIALAFRRWRPTTAASVTEEDRRVVAEARRSGDQGGRGLT